MQCGVVALRVGYGAVCCCCVWFGMVQCGAVALRVGYVAVCCGCVWVMVQCGVIACGLE